MTNPPRKWLQDFLAGRVRLGGLRAAVRAEAMQEDGAWRSAAKPLSPRVLPAVFDVENLRAPMWIAMNDEKLMARHWRADWQFVDRGLQGWAARFVTRAKKEGIPLYVHCAFRGRDEQEALFAEGRSRAHWPDSAHNRGAAVDIVHAVHGWSLSETEWAYIARIGRDVLRTWNAARTAKEATRLEWGGDWAFYDPAHWQLANWRECPVVRPSGPVRRSPAVIENLIR